MVDGNDGANAADDMSLAFASALRDLWSLGTAAVEAALTQGGLGNAAEPLRSSLDPLLRAAASFGDTVQTGAGSTAGARAFDAASVLSQAYLIAAASGFRYWRRLAETYGAHQSDILQSLPILAANAGMSEQQRCILIDELRACLRETGDISLQEARLFQAQLEQLAAVLASPPEEPMSEGATPTWAHRRRWRVKP